ncbi:unnamed protein product, partial [marine sediment metagenome]
MSKTGLGPATGIVAIVTMLYLTANLPAEGQDYLSPLALVADSRGKTLYIAEVTAKQIAVFDIAAGKVKKLIPLPDPPSGLALAPDGLHLYVTTAAPNG